MKVIIPMAGMGKRMRPHTLTMPKPLIPLAGKPIVHHLIDELIKVSDEKIEEIIFVIGRFGKQVEEDLKAIALSYQTQPTICYQYEALGTGHAVLCAEKALGGSCIVAFADTLFKADFKLDADIDGTIWVNEVADPSQYGVVKLNSEGVITDFIEKPKQDVGSNLAIIGIYYFKEAELLRDELQKLIDNKITVKGEYQLTDALENMKQNNVRFNTKKVSEWWDCGNQKATLFANQRLLDFQTKPQNIARSVSIENSTIIPPVYIGDKTSITNSVIGPYVSIGASTIIDQSVISQSIVQSESTVKNYVLSQSMVGNHTICNGDKQSLNIGDYNKICAE